MSSAPSLARPLRRVALSLALSAAAALLLVGGVTSALAAAGSAPRIVGGKTTSVRQWPSTVALVHHKSASTYWGQFCGGTLITPRWVLTAAHCVEGTGPRQIDVVAGRSDLRSRSGKRIAAAAVFTNPGYWPASARYDAALIYLARRAPISQRELPRRASQRPADGTQLWTAGWGATLRDFPGRIRSAQVDLEPDSRCTSAYGADVFAPNLMLCAGKLTGGVDSCEGDSGGPLVARGANGGPADLTLVGIVSFGLDCGDPTHPGVYTRVDAVQRWINRRLRRAPEHVVIQPAGRDRRVAAPEPAMLVGLWTWTDATPATEYFYGPEIRANRRVDSMQVRFTSASGNARACTLDGSQCFNEGEWFSLQPQPARRDWSLDLASTTPCLRFQMQVGLAGTRMSGRIAEVGCRP